MDNPIGLFVSTTPYMCLLCFVGLGQDTPCWFALVLEGKGMRCERATNPFFRCGTCWHSRVAGSAIRWSTLMSLECTPTNSISQHRSHMSELLRLELYCNLLCLRSLPLPSLVPSQNTDGSCAPTILDNWVAGRYQPCVACLGPLSWSVHTKCY